VRIAIDGIWSNHYHLSIGGVYKLKDDSYHVRQLPDHGEQQNIVHHLRHQKKSYFVAFERPRFLRMTAFSFRS
jgi:ribosomal protein L21E